MFFGSEKSARIFLCSNFRQANSSYAIQAKVPARYESMIRIISSLAFFWVHNIRSMYFFECKILGSVGPPCHIYTRVPPWDSTQLKIFHRVVANLLQLHVKPFIPSLYYSHQRRQRCKKIGGKIGNRPCFGGKGY